MIGVMAGGGTGNRCLDDIGVYKHDASGCVLKQVDNVVLDAAF